VRPPKSCFALFCLALLCFTLPCFALHCFALLCIALISFALLCFDLPCIALLFYALLCLSLLCFALLYLSATSNTSGGGKMPVFIIINIIIDNIMVVRVTQLPYWSKSRMNGTLFSQRSLAHDYW
jgi:hypothetical protein